MLDFIYLASASPRRRELLLQIGVDHQIIPADIDEARWPDEAPGEYVKRMALEKARVTHARLDSPPQLVLAADTVVVIDDEILGKPENEEHAAAMLKRLSGRCHTVLTGVALLSRTDYGFALGRAELRFRPIKANEAAAYWASGEPQDKAGGYGIQGLGAVFVESLHGSYSAVVGLPLFETARLLASFGYRLLPRNE